MVGVVPGYDTVRWSVSCSRHDVPGARDRHCSETVFVPDTAWRGMRSCSSGVLYKHEQRTQRAVTLAVPNSHLPRKLYICLSASSRRGHRAVVGVRVPGRAAALSSNTSSSSLGASLVKKIGSVELPIGGRTFVI